jgi:hypothetical protein
MILCLRFDERTLSECLKKPSNLHQELGRTSSIENYFSIAYAPDPILSQSAQIPNLFAQKSIKIKSMISFI